jgi:hypothetical protein
MKPGNLRVIQVPIPAALAGWMMRGRVSVFNGALFLVRALIIYAQFQEVDRNDSSVKVHFFLRISD